MRNDVKTLALGALVAAAFGVGQLTAPTPEPAVVANLQGEVLVGSQCQGAPAGSLVLMAEEDGWGADCKEITRRDVTIKLEGGTHG